MAVYSYIIMMFFKKTIKPFKILAIIPWTNRHSSIYMPSHFLYFIIKKTSFGIMH